MPQKPNSEKIKMESEEYVKIFKEKLYGFAKAPYLCKILKEPELVIGLEKDIIQFLSYVYPYSIKKGLNETHISKAAFSYALGLDRGYKAGLVKMAISLSKTGFPKAPKP